MQMISLDQVFQILRPGVPLPFGVRDAAGRLLLAKGLVLHEQSKLLDLLNRGMFVDTEEVKRHVPPARESDATERPTERFSVRWEALLRR